MTAMEKLVIACGVRSLQRLRMPRQLWTLLCRSTRAINHQEGLKMLQECLFEAIHDMGGCARRPAAAEDAEPAVLLAAQPKKGGSKRQGKPSATAVGPCLGTGAACSAVSALPMSACA